MRVCFVQKNAMTYFGVMSLAGYLRPRGHDFSVVIDVLERSLADSVSAAVPDLIGISVVSSEHGWMIDTCALLKERFPETPIIIGGVHAIMYPEILAETRADFLCRCEGETVLERLLPRLAGNRDHMTVDDIPGLVYRGGASDTPLAMNPMPPLISGITWQDDWRLYCDHYPVLANDDMKQFMSQRGCPYDCYFCYNHLIKQRFKGLGRYFRRKEPDLFVDEIRQVATRYGSKFISILDDLFTSDKDWLRTFTGLYRERVGKPFLCQIRADHADEEVVAMLAEAGCFTACVGLETGNEELRRTVLNKKICNEELFRTGELLRKYRINLKTGNMFGIPGETPEMAFETIALNIRIGTKFLGAGMLLPFPGTGIERIALEKGWLEKPLDARNLPASAYDESVFRSPDIPILTNIMCVAQLCVFLPWLFPLCKKIVHMPLRPLFKLIHVSTLSLRFIGERNLGFWYGLSFLWRFRKSL